MRQQLNRKMRTKLRRGPPPGAAPAPTSYERFKQLWDRLGVVAAVAYALGYASRSLHAFDFNFGALPGARFEYFVAGLILLVPIAALAASVLGIYRAGGAIKRWSANNVDRSIFLQQRVIGSIVWASMVAYLARYLLPQSPLRESIANSAAAVFAAAMIFGSILAAGTAKPSQARQPAAEGPVGPSFTWLLRSVLHGMVLLWHFIITLYFGLMLVLFFALATFAGAYALRFVPQEFGGVRPKCAVLDLATDQISPELAALLVDAPAQSASSVKLVRSKRLSVYSTTGPWLVRVSDPSANSAMRRSFRVSEQAVRSVEWVGGATPETVSGGTCPDDK